MTYTVPSVTLWAAAVINFAEVGQLSSSEPINLVEVGNIIGGDTLGALANVARERRVSIHLIITPYDDDEELTDADDPVQR